MYWRNSHRRKESTATGRWIDWLEICHLGSDISEEMKDSDNRGRAGPASYARLSVMRAIKNETSTAGKDLILKLFHVEVGIDECTSFGPIRETSARFSLVHPIEEISYSLPEVHNFTLDLSVPCLNVKRFLAVCL